MSAITFINAVPSSNAPAVEFLLFQGINRVARIGVHAGGSAAFPTTTEHTVQTWQCYAIANGITTLTVSIDDPNATVTAIPNDNNRGVTLVVS